MSTFEVKAFGNTSATEQLKPLIVQRRVVGETDVKFDVLYSGICHSDVHTARSEWGPAMYPCVPGHEIVGRVTEVGAGVTKFKVGDLIGVGCLVDSCNKCNECTVEKEEQFCHAGVTWTYNSKEPVIGGQTFGGYSRVFVVKEHFGIPIPKGLESNLPATAPLLCAGITTYVPLKLWGAAPGKKVGVVGLGGLGHMAVKFAKAFGAHTVLFTTSASKVEEGLRLGAHEVVISKDAAQMQQHLSSFDVIIDTVSADHDMNQLLSLIKKDGSLVLVGLPSNPMSVSAFSVCGGRKRLTGSSVGSIKDTEEMLQFCAEHQIFSEIEMIKAKDINVAWERMIKADVRFRFVIDGASFDELEYQN